MKKKIIIISIICVITITTISFGTLIVQRKYNNIEEEVDNKFIELEESNNTNAISEVLNENTVTENNTVEEQKVDTQEKNENEQQEPQHEEKATVSNSNKSTRKVETKKQYTANYSNREETNEDNTNNEASNLSESETKTETVIVNREPEKKQPVWCDEGGSKHWQGNGANEHGYYQTWDDAWQAAQECMKDSLSGNFMVRQCPCGLYYYWVKKEN